MKLFDLSGQVAIVTGSTKGIGRGIVERMLEHGAKVVVSSRDQVACDATAAELNQKYGKGKEVAFGQASDLEDIASLQAMVDASLAKWGRVDTLVCNAAILPFIGPSSDTPPEFFDGLMRTNVHNNLRLCHMVLPQMVERQDGRIIIIGSMDGEVPSPNRIAYGLSKAALAYMTKALAAEFAPYKIRVNCVEPGLTRSAASEPVWQDEKVLSAMTSNIPLKRMGEPDEVAAAVIFLAGAGGAFTTGANIPVDGGQAALPNSDFSAGLEDIFEPDHYVD